MVTNSLLHAPSYHPESNLCYLQAHVQLFSCMNEESKTMLQANYQCIFTGSMDPIQDAYKYESSRVMDLLKLKAEASEKILESC